MKAKEDKEFQHFNVETIRHLDICDCLELFRTIQFLDANKSRTQKKIEATLKKRIITLVMPGERPFPTGESRPRAF